MCGIAGIYRFRSGRPVGLEEVRPMGELLRHRGPDDEGTFLDGPLGFAHRRLTILDTSRRGRQPMSTPDGSVVIIYNGEIYNYLELREELRRRGYSFITETDTEVLLALYLEHGYDLLSRLNGMFSFALWDRRRQCLFLARDRLGIKPLYYTLDAEGLVFASEIKAIFTGLRHAGSGAGAAPSVRLGLLDAYMSVGYVPTAETLFEGILKLDPGCSMTVSREGLSIQSYWDLRLGAHLELSEPEWCEKVLELLEDAVRLRLRSDVPLGVFLSGGVDSSAVVAMMHRMGVQEIETFTVAYDFGAAFDETVHARKTAVRFGTRHHEVFINPLEFRDSILTMVRHMEEPVTEAAAISLYHVARLARERVVVVLSGEGADEVFGGYPIYKYMQILELYRRLPRLLRDRVLNPLLEVLGPKWRKYTELSRKPLEQRYLGVSFHEHLLKESLYRPEMRAAVDDGSFARRVADLYDRTVGEDPLPRMMYLDVKTWLVDDLLIKADKMTMACSVELRVPFLDYRMVEIGARIPPRLRIKGWTTKSILKKALEPLLPREIIHRGKMGFPTPLSAMFRHGLREYVHDVLTSVRFRDRGYFQPEVVERLLDDHAKARGDHHRVLWQLLVLEEWHRELIDAG